MYNSNGHLIDFDRTACLCDVGLPYLAVTAVGVDGSTHLLLAQRDAIGNCTAGYDARCAHVTHEQLGALPDRFAVGIETTMYRCGRSTRAGSPCRMRVAHPGARANGTPTKGGSITTISPDWNTPAPPEAVRAVLDAIGHASAGDGNGCCAVLAESAVDPDWLAIVGVDTLASLCKGPHASAWWERLRAEAHQLALEVGASDDQLRCTLLAVAMAEARERRADLRVMQLQDSSEFPPSDIACVACQLAGMVAGYRFGAALPTKLEQARRMYGIKDAP
jgi:hypothetical protein